MRKNQVGQLNNRREFIKAGLATSVGLLLGSCKPSNVALDEPVLSTPIPVSTATSPPAAAASPPTAAPPVTAAAPADARPVYAGGHIITRLCTREGDCVEVCPVDCIIPGPKDDPKWGAYFYVDRDTCIDCGACVPVCPSGAAFAWEDLPGEFQADAAMNDAYFLDGPGYWDYDLEEQRSARG